VSEASYESGTSPLSSWIPITGYDKDLRKEKDPEDEEKRAEPGWREIFRV